MDMLCDKDLKVIEDDNHFVMDKVFLEGKYVESGEFYCEIEIYYDSQNQVSRKPIPKKKKRVSKKKTLEQKYIPKHSDFKLD